MRKPDYERGSLRFYLGDALTVLRDLPDGSANCCVTSPPYWGLRDYQVEGQLGLEPTPDEYVAAMVEVFREVRRVLRDDGTLWLNLGDSYNAYNGNAGPGSGFSRGSACDTERPKLESGHGLRTKGLKPKDLVGIPWRVAFALQADGWWLRQDIIWHKPNPMPESVTDRCTKAHEYVFLLAKSERYYFDAKAIQEEWTSGRDDMRKHGVRTGAAYLQQGAVADNTNKGEREAERDQHNYEGGRNRRSVWTVTTKPFKGAHFATFPPDLIQPCILAGCPAGGVVLEPFLGSGTTAMVAQNNGCGCIGIELNPDYMKIAKRRVRQGSLLTA